ncbi:MAG: hypothetical protein ACQUHE_14795 [Bacteroidia bacterium]
MRSEYFYAQSFSILNNCGFDITAFLNPDYNYTAYYQVAAGQQTTIGELQWDSLSVTAGVGTCTRVFDSGCSGELVNEVMIEQQGAGGNFALAEPNQYGTWVNAQFEWSVGDSLTSTGCSEEDYMLPYPQTVSSLSVIYCKNGVSFCSATNYEGM